MDGGEKEEFVKIVIDIPDAELGVGGEGVWSVKVGEDLYEVRNSPLYTDEINFMDVVRAIAPDEHKNPVVQEVARRGGHRTIRILFLEDGKARKDEILAQVNRLGATYEGDSNVLFSLDLPATVSFDAVADYLQECQDKGWLEQSYAPQPQPLGTDELVN